MSAPGSVSRCPVLQPMTGAASGLLDPVLNDIVGT